MPTPTWDRLRADRKAKIVAAGQREFGTHGYARSSLNTIAREAGVAKGSLFQYFHDKNDFFAHLSAISAENIRTHMTEAIAGLDWEHDFFGALTLAFVEWDDYFASHPEDRAMTAAVNLEGDEDARVAVRHAVNPYYLSVLRPLLEFGQSSGQIRADTSLENATAMLLLLLPHLALAPHVKGLDPVLKLDHKSREERLIAFEDLSDMFRRAYGTAE